MTFQTIVHKSKYGYNIHVPALPGCVSQGDTEDEALENIKDAIETYLEMKNEKIQYGRNTEIREVEVALA